MNEIAKTKSIITQIETNKDAYLSPRYTPNDLPFVGYIGKGKKAYRSYWRKDIKSTGDAFVDDLVGVHYASQLMQYILIDPNRRSWVFESVMRDLISSQQKITATERGFLKSVTSALVCGITAMASGKE